MSDTKPGADEGVAGTDDETRSGGRTGSSGSARSGGGAQSGGRTKRRLLFGIKLVVSAVLLAWILRRADPSEVLSAATEVSIPLLLVAYVFNFVGVLITSARWRGLLAAQDVEAPPGFLLKSVLVGMFFNNFLPSTVGGDAMRAYDSYRFAKRGRAATSVVVDRLLGLLVLTLFVLVSFPFAPEISDQVPGLGLWIVAGASILIGVAWSVFFTQLYDVLGRMLGKLPAGLGRVAGKVLGSFATYRGKRAALARAFGWSLLLQANVVIHYIFIARALGLGVPAHHFFLIVPLALYIMMVPVTVNGIGLRETVFALFFAAYGIGNATAVAYAWFAYLGTVMLGLTGGVVYALRRVNPPIAVPGSAGPSGADG